MKIFVISSSLFICLSLLAVRIEGIKLRTPFKIGDDSIDFDEDQ